MAMSPDELARRIAAIKVDSDSDNDSDDEISVEDAVELLNEAFEKHGKDVRVSADDASREKASAASTAVTEISCALTDAGEDDEADNLAGAIDVYFYHVMDKVPAAPRPRMG